MPAKAPDFALSNQIKEEKCLKDYADKWLVLFFFSEDNDEDCTAEIIEFSQKKSKFNSYNSVIVGISPDSVDTHRKFAKKNKIRIELLSDPDKETVKKYKAWGIRNILAEDDECVIRSTFLINPNGMIVYSWKNMQVKGHVKKVLNKVAEFQAG